MTAVLASRPIAERNTSRDPIDFETELGPLPLHGNLPPGLEGALVRNGPNPLFPDPKAHWFLGDGMLHAFYLANGQVHYRNRWVRTKRLAEQQATGAPPAAGFGGNKENDGCANTNVLPHAGRMFALEEAHLPIEINLETLDTSGATDLGGRLQGSFTAHPKTDPHTGEMLFFGYGNPAPLSAGMSFGVISPDGQVTRFERFETPYASMVHDFAITERHVLFPIMPLTGSMDRAMQGRPPYAWEPQLGTRVGLMPRNGSPADIVWWHGPSCYVFHVMNAWEADGNVYADVMQFDAPPLFPTPDGKPAGSEKEPARLTRWRFELSRAANNPAPEFTQTRIEKTPGEFPRIDDRYTGLPYRHGWFASHTGEGEDVRMYAALMHIDHERAERDVYEFVGDDRVSEPVFVPRSPDAPEGDGWVLAIAWRAAQDRSDLLIFDAQQLSKGPLCTAELPHRVPAGFHGNWFPSGFSAAAPGA